MKLKKVIEALKVELRSAGIESCAKVDVELAVLLKETPTGIECEVLDGNSMSSVKAESVHYLTIELQPGSSSNEGATAARNSTRVGSSRAKLPKNRTLRRKSPFRPLEKADKSAEFGGRFNDDHPLNVPSVMRR